MFNCKACGKSRCYWNSVCHLCGYYQHSLISPKIYNYLKIADNAGKLYSRIIDKK